MAPAPVRRPVTHQDVVAAYRTFTVDSFDPIPGPRLTAGQIRKLANEAIEVASCWVETVGHSPPIFASTATESDRDTAYEIIEHFSRLIMWIQRHEDHHLGLADDVEDAAFLHKLHQFDWEAGIDFSAGFTADGQIAQHPNPPPQPPFVRLMFDPAAAARMHTFCMGVYGRARNAAANVSQVNATLYTGLRDWYSLTALQRGKTLLAAKSFSELVARAAGNRRRRISSTSGTTPAALKHGPEGSEDNPIVLSLSSRQARRAGLSEAAIKERWA